MRSVYMAFARFSQTEALSYQTEKRIFFFYGTCGLEAVEMVDYAANWPAYKQNEKEPTYNLILSTPP